MPLRRITSKASATSSTYRYDLRALQACERNYAQFCRWRAISQELGMVHCVWSRQGQMHMLQSGLAVVASSAWHRLLIYSRVYKSQLIAHYWGKARGFCCAAYIHADYLA